MLQFIFSPDKLQKVRLIFLTSPCKVGPAGTATAAAAIAASSPPTALVIIMPPREDK